VPVGDLRAFGLRLSRKNDADDEEKREAYQHRYLLVVMRPPLRKVSGKGRG
jgi:hypothetical protein